MSIILAIDPGPTESAWVAYDTQDKSLRCFDYQPNEQVLIDAFGTKADKLAVEMIASYGMPVGESVFETCVWVGRFIQQWTVVNNPSLYQKVYRKDVKMHLCGSMKAKDGNVRQALMDRYGSTRQAAIGKRACPGPLYGVSGDVWAALGVAVTASEG